MDAVKIQRKPVKSSILKTVGYDETNMLLDVEFGKTGKIVRYQHVPKHIYTDLLRAESIGKYFIYNIRTMFKFVYLN